MKQTQLDVKQEELRQMTVEVSESHLRMEKYRKKGIPYSNRSFDYLHVRLKMPQFTCITLQPLFEACPELEVIIAEKVSKLFYQKINQMQTSYYYAILEIHNINIEA